MRYVFDYGKKQSLEGVGFCPYFWFIHFLFFLLFSLSFILMLYIFIEYIWRRTISCRDSKISFSCYWKILSTEHISMNFLSLLNLSTKWDRINHINMIVIYKYSPHFNQNSIRIWLEKFKWAVSLLALFWHV